MVNAVRTLLLNTDGASALGSGSLGGEYVPPDFVSLTLPSTLSTIRDTLFARKADRLFTNYRLRQYVQLLHASELEEFVLALDPRVTYATRDSQDLFDGAFGFWVTGLNGTTATLSLAGELPLADVDGITSYQYEVEIIDGTNVTVRRSVPTPYEINTYAYTTSGGLTSLIPLAGLSETFVRAQATIGARWQVRLAVRPSLDLGAVYAALKGLGEPLYASLFGVGSAKPTTEPFMTFKNLWEQHTELPYALGGLLLAWAYRAEEVRVHGQFVNATI